VLLIKVLWFIPDINIVLNEKNVFEMHTVGVKCIMPLKLVFYYSDRHLGGAGGAGFWLILGFFWGPFPR